MNTLQAIAAPVGRILISLMFVLMIVSQGAGAYSLDSRIKNRS